ncbi:MAG: gamma-glutamyltransferase [Planctomycetota bacterium]
MAAVQAGAIPHHRNAMRHLQRGTYYLLLAGLLSWLSANAVQADDPDWIARGTRGMVASDSPAASKIGAEVLRAGGNAFDAAVATSYALAVARPYSTGLGGGGFMVAYIAHEKRFVALDFREMAPQAATLDYYVRLHAANPDGPSPSIYGGNAVAVPGQVAGLEEIRQRYGTMKLAELIAPAIELARTGFVVDQDYHDACQTTIKKCQKWPQLKQLPGDIHHKVLGDGTPPKIGSRVPRPDLARALQLISRNGADAVYHGPIGDAIVSAVQAAGGKLTMDDLHSYRLREREPLHVRIGQREIISMPPPSSGGVCLIEALNILNHLEPAGLAATHGKERYPQILVYAFKHAFADRARWLGDPDFAPIPTAYLTSAEYARSLATQFPRPADHFGTTSIPDDGGTSHFCVADDEGNIVALTETINGTFGSLVIAEPFGIILNNQMDDFSTEPGQPNLYGLVQGQANLVGPGKRPLSSMTPTIVFENGKPALVLGASGGPRIITHVLQVMLNCLEFDQPLAEAINAVRLHHQWRPDEVFFDRKPPAALVQSLQNFGEKISDKRKGAIVQAIRFLENGTMVGASDPRKGGRPAGLP